LSPYQENAVNISRRQSLLTLTAAAMLPEAARAAASGSKATPAKPIRLVVLDVGGTLIEDHGEVPQAMRSALTKQGVEVSFAEIGEWRGASKRGMVRHFVELRTKPDADREALIAAAYNDFSMQVNAAYADVRPIAGAEECVRKLRAMGLLVATSTGFDRPLTEKILAHLGGRDYFVAAITSDDVVDGRPSPFMLFHAMEAARVDAVAEVIAVGDTPLDLQAGTNAGLRGVIGVYSGAATEARLRQERYTHILPSVASLPDLVHAEF
jgi:phosphonatase-like hydrolase